MHEEWYYQQVEKYSDVFSNEWEVFTLDKAQTGTGCLLRVKALARELIPSWAESKRQDLISQDYQPSNYKTPHPRLLYVMNEYNFG
jgi:hypothetical protein